MPAIQPAKLKRQIAELTRNYNQPATYIRELHSLLELYSDHTQHHGQTGIPFPLLGSYNTPPPIMRQVWHELSKFIELHPTEFLQLCDALWAEPNYDMRLLAARILGQLPILPIEPVIDRLQSWVNTGLDKRLLENLMEHGLKQLQQDAPDKLLELVSTWLVSSETSIQQAGLRAMVPIIRTSGIENLPAIFRLITPYLRVAPSVLRPDILAVLIALIHSSPSETAYLLRQNLTAPDNADTPWIIRQVLAEFPEELRASLRTAQKGTE